MEFIFKINFKICEIQSVPNCPAVWKTGEWGECECSATNGQASNCGCIGHYRRKV